MDPAVAKPTSGERWREGDREARFGSSQELSPEEDTVQKRREARLHHAYRLLSQEDRVLLELYYHFEHSMSEIGEILGCSKGWVSRRHSAILDRLRTGMEPESGRSNAPGRQSFSSCPFSGSDGVSESEASSAHVPNGANPPEGARVSAEFQRSGVPWLWSDWYLEPAVFAKRRPEYPPG